MDKQQLIETLERSYQATFTEFTNLCNAMWLTGSFENFDLLIKHKEKLEDLLLSYGTRIKSLRDFEPIPLGQQRTEPYKVDMEHDVRW